MSWGTCYSASNNIHFDFPPIMADGRNYANWQPGSVLSDRIRQENHITSNNAYRKYMIENADTLIKMNQLNAVEQCTGIAVRYDTGLPVSQNMPYVFKSTSDMSQAQTFGYEHSDLKQQYLTKTELESRMITPVLTQEQLMRQGYQREK